MSQPSPWQPWQEQGVARPQPQPWQGQSVPQPWPSSASMLASHADRERAVDVLRAGFSEGRLQQDELEKRVARAYEARTVGELGLIVADLPQGPVPLPAAAPYVPRTFVPMAVPKTNDKAVGSAICGALCLATAGLTGIPAVVLGHAARAEVRRTGERGDGLALTGLVLGWLSIAGWALVLALLLTVSLATA